MHLCKRCGELYDWENQEPPENASIYWEPHCPVCNAKLTATAVDNGWMNIIGSDLDSDNDNYEYYRKRVHYQARLCHGRLAGVDVDGLIERAQEFDEQANVGGRRISPNRDRDVAFTLRKQARQKQSD